MRKPRIPHMLVNLVLTVLTAYDGTVFENRKVCPMWCENFLKGMKKEKQFAIIHNG